VTQISRPFQIALAAVALLLVIWLVALRGHSGGGSSSSAPAAASTPAPAAGSASSSSGAGASKGAPGGGTPASSGGIYHGSAPGVAGLTRAIAKARGAVKLSEQNAQQLQRESAQASSAGSSGATASGAATSHSAAPGSSAPTRSAASPSKPAGTKPATSAPTTGAARKVASTPAKQSLVESELKSGRTVIVLFSSSKGAVDAVVRGQLALLDVFLKSTATLPQNRDIAVHYASPGEVGAYGRVTRSLQILQTPTILVITPSGRTKTLTGLVDAYAIRQAIKEARKP
jgi:hypothetical protein